VIRVGGGVVEVFCDALRRGGCGYGGEEDSGCLVIQQTNAVGEETKIAPPLSERGCDA
jgi:hypothetical protein